MSTNNEISLFLGQMHKINYKAFKFKEIFNNSRQEVIKMKYLRILPQPYQIKNVDLFNKIQLKFFKIKIKNILCKMLLKKRLKSFQVKIQQIKKESILQVSLEIHH